MLTKFSNYLENNSLSKNTIVSYVAAVNSFLNLYKRVNESNLAKYKCWLLENYKPETVNLRLQAINKYLIFIKKRQLKLKLVKIQQKQYVENIISNADYLFLKDVLRSDGNIKWHIMIWLLATTGARISELLQLKSEHIHKGYMDVYGKGCKFRRLYIPKKPRNNAIQWIAKQNISSGYVFKNRSGRQMTARGVASQFKRFAVKYGLNSNMIYPHSFRHRFAKNFLNKCNDITLLADLMGHTSVETTRIYLRRTADEQQNFINKIVTW